MFPPGKIIHLRYGNKRKTWHLKYVSERELSEIKVSELQRFFKKIQRNKGVGILSSPDIEAVLKDMETNLNLPVVIKKKGNEFEVLKEPIEDNKIISKSGKNVVLNGINKKAMNLCEIR